MSNLEDIISNYEIKLNNQKIINEKNELKLKRMKFEESNYEIKLSKLQKDREKCHEDVKKVTAEKQELQKKCETLKFELELNKDIQSNKQQLFDNLMKEKENLVNKLNEYQKNDLEIKYSHESFKSKENCLQYKEQIWEDERRSFQQIIANLEAELSKKQEAFFQMKTEYNDEKMSNQTLLKSHLNQINKLQRSNELLINQNQKLGDSVSELEQKLKKITEQNTDIANSYKSELESYIKISELHETNARESKEKVEKLVATMTEMQKFLHLANQENSKLETEKVEILREKNEQIMELRAKLQSAESVAASATANASASFGIASTAHIQKTPQRTPDKSNSKLRRPPFFSQHHTSSPQLLASRQSVLEISSFAIDNSGSGAPPPARRRRLQGDVGAIYETTQNEDANSVEEVHQQQLTSLKRAHSDLEHLKGTNEFLTRQVAHLKKKFEFAARTNCDLSQQVRALLCQIELDRGTVFSSEREESDPTATTLNQTDPIISKMSEQDKDRELFFRDGPPPPSQAVGEAAENATKLANDVISDQLISFKTLSEMQRQNARLVMLVRDFGEQIEQKEREEKELEKVTSAKFQQYADQNERLRKREAEIMQKLEIFQAEKQQREQQEEEEQQREQERQMEIERNNSRTPLSYSKTVSSPSQIERLYKMIVDDAAKLNSENKQLRHHNDHSHEKGVANTKAAENSTLIELESLKKSQQTLETFMRQQAGVFEENLKQKKLEIADLQAELEDKLTQCAIASQQLEEMRGKHDALTRKIEVERQKTRSLQNEADTSHRTQLWLRAELEARQRELSTRQDELRNRAEAERRTQQEHQASQAGLLERLGELQAELARHKTELYEARLKWKSKKAKLLASAASATLANTATQQSDVIVASISTNSPMNDVITEHQKQQLSELTESTTTTSTTTTTGGGVANEKWALLQSANEELEARLLDMTHLHTQLSTRCGELESAAHLSANQVAELTRELADAQRRLAEMGEERATLEEAHSQHRTHTQHEAEAQHARIAQLENELAELRNQRDEAERATSELQHKYREEMTSHADDSDRLAELRNEVGVLRRGELEWRQKCSAVQSELDAARSSLAELEQSGEEKRNQLEQRLRHTEADAREMTARVERLSAICAQLKGNLTEATATEQQNADDATQRADDDDVTTGNNASNNTDNAADADNDDLREVNAFLRRQCEAGERDLMRERECAAQLRNKLHHETGRRVELEEALRNKNETPQRRQTDGGQREGERGEATASNHMAAMLQIESVHSLTESNQLLRAQRTAQLAELTALRNQLEETQRTHTRLAEELSEAQQNAAGLRERLEVREADAARWQHACVQLSAQQEQSASARECTLTELENARTQLRNTQHRLDTLVAQHAATKTDLDTARVDHQKLQDAMKNLEEKNEKIIELAKRYRSEVETSRSSEQRLQAKNYELERELDEFQMRLKVIESKFAQQQQQQAQQQQQQVETSVTSSVTASTAAANETVTQERNESVIAQSALPTPQQQQQQIREPQMVHQSDNQQQPQSESELLRERDETFADQTAPPPDNTATTDATNYVTNEDSQKDATQPQQCTDEESGGEREQIEPKLQDASLSASVTQSGAPANQNQSRAVDSEEERLLRSVALEESSAPQLLDGQPIRQELLQQEKEADQPIRETQKPIQPKENFETDLRTIEISDSSLEQIADTPLTPAVSTSIPAPSPAPTTLAIPPVRTIPEKKKIEPILWNEPPKQIGGLGMTSSSSSSSATGVGNATGGVGGGASSGTSSINSISPPMSSYLPAPHLLGLASGNIGGGAGVGEVGGPPNMMLLRHPHHGQHGMRMTKRGSGGGVGGAGMYYSTMRGSHRHVNPRHRNAPNRLGSGGSGGGGIGGGGGGVGGSQ